MKFKLFTVIFALALCGLWVLGGQLSSPVYATAGSPPAGYISETIEHMGVHGWYFPARERKVCVLLMHGVRSSRKEMLGRAIFFRDEGYSSMAIDLQAHGETPGDEITYGFRESNSARAAVDFLRNKKNCRKIVSIGSSLGGAASLLGQSPLNVDAFILEAVYPRIEKAIENRLTIRLGYLGGLLAPLLYLQIPSRLGIDLQDLKPVDAVKNVNSPILIMNGSEDQRTTIEDAKELFNSASSPKKLYLVHGAGHTNLYNYDPDNYKKVVLAFISEHVDND